MSRAILQIALARTLRRQPTDMEMAELIAALQECAGERVYIPQRHQADPQQIMRVLQLRKDNWSIRKIAKAEGVSKSRVHIMLSTNSDLFVDTA